MKKFLTRLIRRDIKNGGTEASFILWMKNHIVHVRGREIAMARKLYRELS